MAEGGSIASLNRWVPGLFSWQTRGNCAKDQGNLLIHCFSWVASEPEQVFQTRIFGACAEELAGQGVQKSPHMSHSLNS